MMQANAHLQIKMVCQPHRVSIIYNIIFLVIVISHLFYCVCLIFLFFIFFEILYLVYGTRSGLFCIRNPCITSEWTICNLSLKLRDTI